MSETTPTTDTAPVTPIARAGYIALVGRPNVGKSTLMNALLGQKISIVTAKPQTTRQRILGIKQSGDAQLVFVDTPGIHGERKKALHRYMNRAATRILPDVDIAVWLLDGDHWTAEDELVLDAVKRLDVPVGLVINKIDRLKHRDKLLPLLQARAGQLEFAFVVPLSALKGTNLDALEQEIIKCLPESGPLFPADQVTDISERFLAAELIREKMLAYLQQEVPYGVAIEIERFERSDDGVLEVNGLIWVERNGHKRIVIGKGGTQMKAIGRAARLDMIEQFDARVHLELWVKVKSGWSDDERALRQMGFVEG